MLTLNPPLTPEEGEQYSEQIHQTLTAQGVDHGNIRYLSTSMNHAFSDNEKVFCKLLGTHRDLDGFKTEIKIGNITATEGLTTRSLLPSYVLINDTPLTAFGYIEGTSYQENELNPTQVLQILETLTEYHARTEEPTNKYGLPPLTEVAQYTDWFLGYENDEYSAEVQKTKQLVRDHIHPMHDLRKKDNSILHADVRSPNFILTPDNQTFMCDFESALYGAPEYDYGLLAFNLETHKATDEVWDAFYNYVTHQTLDYSLIVQSAKVKLVKSIIANFRMKKYERVVKHLNYFTSPRFTV